jgi:hypothetical protein
MVLRPGGKEGRPSGGADASANVSACLGVAASAQTSEEEQALLVLVLMVVEEEESAMLSAADAGELVSLAESHHCVSMAVEGKERRKVIGENSRKRTGWVG